MLVLCKILRLFVNTLTDNDKLCLLDNDNLTQPIQILLSQKQKTFSQFFSYFLKSTLNFKHFQKKMTLIADLFPKLPSSKKVTRSISVKFRFRGLFHNKHGKRARRLLKSAQRYLCHICLSLCTSPSWKKSMLGLCKILRLFINTLTDKDKYCLLYRDNLTQPIQILLSQKQKTSSEFFSDFLKSTLNFVDFQKKMALIADVFPKLPSRKKVIR